MFDDVQIHDMVKVYFLGGDCTGNYIGQKFNPTIPGVRPVRLRASNGKIIKIRADSVQAVVNL